MLIQTCHHTITLHDDFVVIVPHPGYELTSESLTEIKDHIITAIQTNDDRNSGNLGKGSSLTPVLFFPHSQYSVSFCAMKELINVQDKIQLGIISGSERTRMVFDFLTDLCKGVNILSNTHEMSQWLSNSLTIKRKRS